MTKITASFLARHLEAGCGELEPSELAFLALTSKIELPVRDRMAWSLYKELWPGSVVAREWRRVDLAILPAGRPDEPDALVQAKAIYTFDLVSSPSLRSYEIAILADIGKAAAVSGKDSRTFIITLATHPEVRRPFARELARVVKYMPSINRSLQSHGDSPAIRARAGEAMRERFGSLGEMVSGSIDGGAAFDVAVFLDYWIIESTTQISESDDSASLPSLG